MLETFAIVQLLFFCSVGFLFVFFTSFGTLLILFGVAIFAAIDRFDQLPLSSVVFILILYLIGEIAEYLCVMWGAKAYGASKRAILGALIGGIAGALFLAWIPGIGVFLGGLLGIFFGAFLGEFTAHQNFKRSIRAGTGGILGRVSSIVVKVFVCLFIFGILFSQLL